MSSMHKPACLLTALLIAGLLSLAANAQSHHDDAGHDHDHLLGEFDGPGLQAGAGAGGPGSPGRMLSEEEVDLAIEIIELVRPEMAERIANAAEDRPALMAAVIGRRMPRVMMFLDLRERNPQMFELRLEDLRLNRESQELAEAFRHARDRGDTDEAQDLREALTDLVVEHFEIRQEIREMELAALEQRIERLRDEVAERQERSEELVNARLRELAGDPASW